MLTFLTKSEQPTNKHSTH